MGLLKKDAKKKPIRLPGYAAKNPTSSSPMRPRQIGKTAPCWSACPSGNDIRLWLQAVAQRGKLGYSEEEAFTRAWNIIVETNPFPSVMGRICPNPCQKGCNRSAKDGAVAINLCERFIGDWGLKRRLELPKPDGELKPESVGVIGAGPGGLSFAYQMARRGYKVTVYEKTGKAGGMIFWGIPFYRQPEDILAAEIRRILDMGVELRLDTAVGRDVSAAELKAKHQVIYIGTGAHKGKLLQCPGEEGPGVWTGTDYLRRVKAGEKVDPGKIVAVIGGGDTAVDAAREARRSGADVTIFYRRTRAEMPAIESEIEDALVEGVKIACLAAPVEIRRESGKVVAMRVRKMELGDPDASGRRRPVPVDGSEYEIELDAVIAAISQEPEGGPEGGLGELYPNGSWVAADQNGKVADGLWSGGDVIGLGLAVDAIGHGRRAAEQAHRELRGLDPVYCDPPLPVLGDRIKMELEDVYPTKPQAKGMRRPAEEWLSKPREEIALGISGEQFLDEVTRCFSCGLCFGCERCWMYCTPGCFKKTEDVKLGGSYYSMKLETCDGCKKCRDECPCGCLDME